MCPAPACVRASGLVCLCVRLPSEQRLAGIVQFLDGLHIGQCPRQLLLLQQRHTGPQEVRRAGQAGQFVQRRHRIAWAVNGLNTPGLFGVGQLGGEEAWPVVTEARVEALTAVGAEARKALFRLVSHLNVAPDFQALTSLDKTFA